MTAWRRQVEAFREWSRRPSDERWRQVGVAALTLVLLLIALAVRQRAALPILFLLPVAACIVLGLLWSDAREWLIENAIPQGALLLSGWLLGAFVLWLVVNAVWANQAQRLAGDHTALTVAGVTLTAGVAYPAVALADAADNALQLSFSADAAVPLPRQVLTATVTLSDTLAFATAGGPSTRDFLVPLTLGQPGSQRIGIVNSGVYGGWRGREATITVRLCAAGNVCADDLKLTVRPEGRDGYAVRRFVNSTIDQSSPIILLLLFVVPGVAVWAQRVLEGRQGALEKQRTEDCAQIIKDFRGYFCAQQIKHAEEGLRSLNKSRFRRIKEFERKLAAQLHQLTTLIYPLPKNQEHPYWNEWPDLWIIWSGPEWPREFVTAGLMAQQRLGSPDLSADYQNLYGTNEQPFDFEAYAGPRLRAFLHRLWMVLRRIPLAADDELFIERERMDEQRREDEMRGRPLLYAVPHPYTPRSHGLAQPFAWGDASRTEEIRFLIDGQAFWGNHPLIRELRHGDHSVIVHGASGSGRTALATVLPLAYVNDPADLFVHIDAGAKRGEVVAAVAEQLLRFVLRQPTFLSLRRRDQQEKLAHFLATWLEHDKLATPIQSRLNELRRASQAATNDAQQRESHTSYEELARFRQLLPAMGNPRNNLDTVNWPGVFLESVHILEFWNVVFIMTLDRSRLNWLMDWGNFTALYELGIHFWLFVDDGLQDELFLDAPHAVPDLRLAWPEEHLPYFRAMLDWRFEKYLDLANLWPERERRRALASCFADGETGLKRLIEASKVNGEYNPRQFMTLWRKAAGDKEVGQLITTADVDWALEKEGAP